MKDEEGARVREKRERLEEKKRKEIFIINRKPKV